MSYCSVSLQLFFLFSMTEVSLGDRGTPQIERQAFPKFIFSFKTMGSLVNTSGITRFPGKWVIQWFFSQLRGKGLCSYEWFCLWPWEQSVFCLLVLGLSYFGPTVVTSSILLQARMKVKHARSISAGFFPLLPHFWTASSATSDVKLGMLNHPFIQNATNFLKIMQILQQCVLWEIQKKDRNKSLFDSLSLILSAPKDDNSRSFSFLLCICRDI